MPHTADPVILNATISLADAQATRDAAIESVLDGFNDDYDELDPEDDTEEIAALIEERNTAIAAVMQTYDDTFCYDMVSEIHDHNPDRLNIWFHNTSSGSLYLYIGTEQINTLESTLAGLQTTRDAANAVVLAAFDAAVAALDPEDVDYATDLAALRAALPVDLDTANSTYDTAQAAASPSTADAFTFVTANGGRFEFPGQGAFDGPVYGRFANENGQATATETRRR